MAAARCKRKDPAGEESGIRSRGRDLAVHDPQRQRTEAQVAPQCHYARQAELSGAGAVGHCGTSHETNGGASSNSWACNLVAKKFNELVDPQAQMLVGFLKEMGLPSDGIIADQTERRAIGDNLDGLIRNLPDEIKKNARYLSKVIVGAGLGLFG